MVWFRNSRFILSRLMRCRTDYKIQQSETLKSVRLPHLNEYGRTGRFRWRAIKFSFPSERGRVRQRGWKKVYGEMINKGEKTSKTTSRRDLGTEGWVTQLEFYTTPKSRLGSTDQRLTTLFGPLSVMTECTDTISTLRHVELPSNLHLDRPKRLLNPRVLRVLK